MLECEASALGDDRNRRFALTDRGLTGTSAQTDHGYASRDHDENLIHLETPKFIMTTSCKVAANAPATINSKRLNEGVTALAGAKYAMICTV